MTVVLLTMEPTEAISTELLSSFIGTNILY